MWPGAKSSEDIWKANMDRSWQLNQSFKITINPDIVLIWKRNITENMASIHSKCKLYSLSLPWVVTWHKRLHVMTKHSPSLPPAGYILLSHQHFWSDQLADNWWQIWWSYYHSRRRVQCTLCVVWLSCIPFFRLPLLRPCPSPSNYILTLFCCDPPNLQIAHEKGYPAKGRNATLNWVW